MRVMEQVTGSNGLLSLLEKHLPVQVMTVIFGPAICARPDRRHCRGGTLPRAQWGVPRGVRVRAPVAQGIEHRFPKPCAQVRILPGAQKNPGSRVRAPSDGNQLGICASHSGTGRLRRPMSRSFSALDVPIRRRMRGEFHRAPQENNATNAPLARDGALDTVHASSGTVVS